MMNRSPFLHLSSLLVGGPSAAFVIALYLGLAGAIGPAAADKVGVAAAVNPDAFSSLAGAPQSQINIGKSIFFSERINTTGSGLVQVLLVDGSTFTVGPGSDLVIDKFVYDPKKGTGQIAASFSKGVMRFVGGKISKNEGGVTVDTPAGALAIRGGMFQAKLNGSGGGIFSFLYGRQMTLGSKYTVYEPGYTIDTTNGTPTIRPTTSADINAIMASLNGNTSGLGNNSTDGSKPSAELMNTQSLSQLISDANATQIQSEIQDQLNDQQNGPPPETVPLPTELTMRVLTTPDYYVADKRSFWSPGIFIADPGAHGIVGGDDIKIPCFITNVCADGQWFFEVQTDDYDVTSSSIANGRVTGPIPSLIARNYQDTWPYVTYDRTPEGRQFDFPIFNVVGVHAVSNAQMIDENGVATPLVGSAFTGRGGGFFAYQLFEAEEIEGQLVANLDKPILAFGGTPFEKPDLEPDQLRLFNLYTDPRQGISIPFAAAATSPANLAGATVQPLYLLEDSGESGRPVWLQTSFLISGNGANQQSILVLALGEQNENGQLEGVRRGMSYIPTAFLDTDQNPDTPSVPFKQPINLTGNIATLAGADGETYMFGDQLPHFVIGADSTGQGHKIFEDQPLYPGAFPSEGPVGTLTNALYDGPNNSDFVDATYHIGEQVAQTDTSTLTPVTTDADVDFYGYAAGIYQQTTDNLEGDEDPVGILINSNPTDVHLKFKDENRVSAFFDLSGAGESGEGGAQLAFGDWGNASGRSTVINGDIYAAVESATQRSTVRVEGPYGGHFDRTADASLYLVSGKLLNPNVAPCAKCDFIKWGTWGGQLQFKDGGPYPQPNVTADVNLGWYVAGDLTTVGQIDTLAATGATATYNGGVIGNVASLQGDLWNTYVATGDLVMNWNFAQLAGDLTISNFDQRTYTTGPNALTQPSLDLNKFSGELNKIAGPSIGLETNTNVGNVAGSFVNNGPTPAAGVVGNFNIHGNGYGATGVFASAR